MMKLYDDAVLEAAAAREAGDSVGAWKLADALTIKFPPEDYPHGGDRRSDNFQGSDVATLSLKAGLNDQAEVLTQEGISTPNGVPYSGSTLYDLHRVAAAWTKDKRYPQAAFRTHQEAGSPGSEADTALKALCKYAAGGVKRRPTDVDSDDWAKAVKMVDRLMARKAKYMVSANALRAAMQRKNNTHTPEAYKAPEAPEPVTATSVAAAVKGLPEKDRAALVRELVTTDPQARKSAETTVRQVKSNELAVEHERFVEEHGSKRRSNVGGPADAPKRTMVDQPLAALGILIETESMRESLPKVIKLISDKRDLLGESDIEYLAEWLVEVRRDLDILDELVKLGRGLTDEDLADLLRGE